MERLSGKSSLIVEDCCSKTCMIRSHACLRWLSSFLVVLLSFSSSEEEESWGFIGFLCVIDLSPAWKVVSLVPPAVVDKFNFEESID
jgi:hypothetical protein